MMPYMIFFLKIDMDQGSGGAIHASQFNLVLNSCLAPLMCLCIMRYCKRRATLVIIVHLVVLFWLLSSSLYYGYFRSVPHIALVRQLHVLPGIVGHLILQAAGLLDLMILVCSGTSIFMCFLFMRRIPHVRPNRIAWTVMLCVAVFYGMKSAAVQKRYPLAEYYENENTSALKLHGFMPVLMYQIYGMFDSKTEEVPYPGRILDDVTLTTTFTLAVERPNIIMIQVESLDCDIIDFVVNGQPVMPFLKRLKSQSIYFKNFYSHHAGGATADAELSTLTSLLPLESHSGFLTADFKRVDSLAKILVSNGYYTAGLHANRGSFFERQRAFLHMGFNRFHDVRSFQGEAAGWHSRDESFFQQAVPMIKSFPEPFLAYLITMQSHGPFRNHKKITFGNADFPNRSAKHYIMIMHEVDKALEVLFGLLEKEGLLDRSICLVFSDHQSSVQYGFKDKRPPDNIPLLIYAPEVIPNESEKIASHVDLAPTVCDMTKTEASGGWLGSSILRSGEGRVLLNNHGKLEIITPAESNGIMRTNAPEHYRKFNGYSSAILK